MRVRYQLAGVRQHGGPLAAREHVFGPAGLERYGGVGEGGRERGAAEQRQVQHEVAGEKVGGGAWHVQADEDVVGLVCDEGGVEVYGAGGGEHGVAAARRGTGGGGVGVVEVQVHRLGDAEFGDVGVVEDGVGDDGEEVEDAGGGGEEDRA